MRFVYDGDCGFCTRSARFLARRIPAGGTELVAWQQADLSALGLTPAACQEAVQLVGPGASPLAGPDAIAALLRTSHLRRWRLAGAMLARAPIRWLAVPGYRWIARHRLPGGAPACALPQ